VIGYLETATQGNKSSAAIEAALDKVCNVLPGSLKDNCTAFVKKYGPIIAFLLKKNSTTVEICDFLKVCNNGTQQITPSKINIQLFFFSANNFYL
jgi:saposin